MNYIIRERKTGKTTELIKQVKQNKNSILIVPTERQRRLYIQLFKLDPFKVIAWTSAQHVLAGHHYDVYIDDLDSILYILLGNIKTVTLNKE